LCERRDRRKCKKEIKKKQAQDIYLSVK
jgi:hypothetical protein